jgi:hypothetical protein
MVDVDNPLTHLGSKTRGLDAVHHDRQVGILGGLDQDTPIAILDFVQVPALAASKGILDKVSNCGQHAADKVRIERFVDGLGDVPQQQACLSMDEKNLIHGKRQRVSQGHLSAGDTADLGLQTAPDCTRAERGAHLAVDVAG